jgi:hypothetical protein
VAGERQEVVFSKLKAAHKILYAALLILWINTLRYRNE